MIDEFTVVYVTNGYFADFNWWLMWVLTGQRCWLGLSLLTRYGENIAMLYLAPNQVFVFTNENNFLLLLQENILNNDYMH